MCKRNKSMQLALNTICFPLKCQHPEREYSSGDGRDLRDQGGCLLRDELIAATHTFCLLQVYLVQ